MSAEPAIMEDPWMYHMLRGDFEAAWKISDAVLQERAGKPCWHLPRHQQSIWNGSALEGKRVLVRCYHGLGDTVQFIRFAPLIRAQARELIVWAQPALIPLLETVAGIDRLLPLHNGAPEADFDVDVEIMELAYLFRVRPDTLPRNIPYIHVSPIKLLPHDNRPAVGLVWRTGPWDPRRCIPFQVLAPLFQISATRLFILQGEAEAAGWKEGFGINPGPMNLMDYARVVKGLDLLVTVDSMHAHMAGALGVPVWNLLHAEADWRLMREREDTPWYPSMKLVRQRQPGNWEEVVARVAEAIREGLFLQPGAFIEKTSLLR